MKCVLVFLALVCATQARLIAVGFRDYDSGYAGLEVQPMQYTSLEGSTTDNLYSQYPQQFESAWASQQLDLLNSLQSFMLAPPVSRCGGHAKARELQAPSVTSSMTPLVVSYLASARLGSLPAVFDGFSQAAAENAMQETESHVQSDDVYSVADLMTDALVDSLVGSTDLDSEPEQLQPEQVPFSEAQPSVASTLSNVAQDASTQPEPLERLDDIAQEEQLGGVNWGLVFFIVQTVACAAVWMRLMYVWCSLGGSCMPQSKDQAQFMTVGADDMHSPLLAPVQEDGPRGAIKSYTKNVEVASEHVPEGVEYVSIAYVPLKGEE